MKAKMTIESIMPKKAEQWLGGNTINRTKRPSVAEKYAGIMARDEWKLNGEAIKFNGDGTLLDGQHRLMAIKLSGKTIQSYVIRGLETGIIETLDQGTPRRYADILHWKGEKNAKLLSAAIRAIHVYGSGADAPKLYRESLSVDQMQAIFDKNPKIRDSANFSRSTQVHVLTPASIATALHYLMGKKDADLSTMFWESVASGEQLRKIDPAYVLRERYIANRSSQTKFSMLEHAAMAIKAWSYLRDGKPCKFLRWAFGDQFPVIK